VVEPKLLQNVTKSTKVVEPKLLQLPNPGN